MLIEPRIAHARGAAEPPLITETIPAFFAAMAARQPGHPALVSRQMVEDVLRYKRLDGVAAALEALAAAWFPNGSQRENQAAAIPALKMPVQIIWGGDDRIIPAAHGRAFAGDLPVHIIEQTGHLPHMEKSGDVNRLIGRFLDQLP